MVGRSKDTMEMLLKKAGNGMLKEEPVSYGKGQEGGKGSGLDFIV